MRSAPRRFGKGCEGEVEVVRVASSRFPKWAHLLFSRYSTFLKGNDARGQQRLSPPQLRTAIPLACWPIRIPRSTGLA